jgi:TolB-like protein
MCCKEASGGLTNRVRANVQLIDAETDTHRWAERFDGDAGIGDLQ